MSLKGSYHSHKERKGGGNSLGLAHPLGAAALPLLYIEWWCSSLLSWFTCHFVPLPAAPPKKAWLRRSPAEIFSPPPPPSSCVVGVPGGSSTSAAPLERGIGGRRQAARVTEYGSAARLWRSSSRPWGRKVIVRHHTRLFVGTLSRLRSTRVSPSRQRFDRYLHLLDMILGFLWLQP